MTIIACKDSGTVTSLKAAGGVTADGVTLGVVGATSDGYPALEYPFSATDRRWLAAQAGSNSLMRAVHLRPSAATSAMLYFDLMQFQNVPYRIADKTRWNGVTGAAIALDTTEAGSYVVNILGSETAKLASVAVGDPVWLRLDPLEWVPTQPRPSGFPLTLNYSYQWAVVVAIGDDTVTLSRPLISRVSRDTRGSNGNYNAWQLGYAWTDFEHPNQNAAFGIHFSLWDPDRLRSGLMLGTELAIINQLTAGRSVSGGASVTGVTWAPDAWPMLPGNDATANAVHDVTLGTASDSVRFPGTSCVSGKPHVCRFSVVSQTLAGGATLECQVEDGSGVAKSSVVSPDMMGGIDLVSIPFTPTATGTHYLRITQEGDTDASCYISEVEYRQIGSGGSSQALPISGMVYYAGDSNSVLASALYIDGTLTDAANPTAIVPAMLTPERAVTNLVTGRTMAKQARDSAGAMTEQRYALAISNETSNSVNLAISETSEIQAPFSPSPAVPDASNYQQQVYYWAMQAAALSDLVLFLGQNRIGEHATLGYDYADQAALFTRAQRQILSW